MRAAVLLVGSILLCAACSGQAFTSGADPADGSAGSAPAGTGGQAGSAATGSGGVGTAGSGTAGSGTAGSGTAGAAGTANRDGGAAGAGGHAGASVDAGGSCPSALPSSSQPCSSEGLSCPYGKCCPTHAICSGGKWQIAITDCIVPGCPLAAPTAGASCTCVSTPVPCHYECATGAKSIDATCVNDVWSTQTSTCAAIPCGQSMCMPGEICVQRAAGPGFLYQCATNPCVGKPLSCGCASSLCQTGDICGVNGTTLSCTCRMCV